MPVEWGQDDGGWERWRSHNPRGAGATEAVSTGHGCNGPGAAEAISTRHGWCNGPGAVETASIRFSLLDAGVYRMV